MVGELHIVLRFTEWCQPLQETAMSSAHRFPDRPIRQLRRSPLAPYVDAFERYLGERDYAPHRTATYLGCLAHFGRWMDRRLLQVESLDENRIAEFLDGHLPQCDCAAPVVRTREDLSAALGHLLVVLRADAAIAERMPGTTPVDEELRRFDERMDRVQGLAPTTRTLYLRTVRRLLVEQFGERAVDFGAITPERVRRFVASQSVLYSTPGSAATLISALRGYFRFRATCGDRVHALIGVLPYPANWQLASLPKGLSDAEVRRLVDSLGWEGPSARRADAMVRCALDLGLRAGEIAKLALDDIDWQAGTIMLRRTKSRREDTLPLPQTTGRAIADYLVSERPPNASRAVFVRRIAPCDRPLGADCVRKTIRQAYARAGLPYTRAHLLRHTMASRLLTSGSSLKEVADVLRHRSLNTTLIYAKLDSRNLTAVALPWPGGTA
jgi:integrase/recombinase XerC